MKKITLAYLATAFLLLSGKGYTSLTENDLAEQACRIATASYEKINQHWHYPLNCEQKVETTPSWKSHSIRTNNGMTSVVLWDAKVQPSLMTALDEIMNASLIMECSNAARLVRLRIITGLLGEEKTNHLISQLRQQHSSSDFNVLNSLSWQFFDRINHLDVTEKEKNIYFFPFVNHPRYTQFKPLGAAHNHNVVFTKDGYLGFAPDFFTVPKSYEELVNFMYGELVNSNDLIEKAKKAHAFFCGTLTLERFAQEREQHQNTIGYYKLNLQKVLNFIKS